MITYSSYADVPLDITYPSAWRQRGYAVREGEKPIARLLDKFSGKQNFLPLYGLSQCRHLRGEPAKRRRQAFIAALYKAE